MFEGIMMILFMFELYVGLYMYMVNVIGLSKIQGISVVFFKRYSLNVGGIGIRVQLWIE